MKIGVISDTHIPRAAKDLPKKVYEAFESVDMILHAGDLVELAILEKLKKIAPVEAVHGNMDDHSTKMQLPEKKVIEAGKFKIGLIHGFGGRNNIVNTVWGEFDGVDAIVFGHSHTPLNETRDGILFFNPGSPTDKFFAKTNTFGVIEINDFLKGRIVQI